MKKRIVTLVALILCASTLICFTGCDMLSGISNVQKETEGDPTDAPTYKPTEAPDNSADNGNKDENSNSDNKDEENKLPLTDAEIFSEIKEALAATKTYSGSFHIDMTYKGVDSDRDPGAMSTSVNSQNIDASATFDAEQEQLLSVNELSTYYNSSKTSSSKSVEKFFSNSNKHFKYVDASGEKHCYSLTESQWDRSINTMRVYEVISDYLCEGFGELLSGESISDLSSAYETVLKALVEAYEKQYEEKGFSTLNDPIHTYTVKFEEADNGELSMNIQLQVQSTMGKDTSETGEAVTVNNIIYAKDGKITGFKIYTNYYGYKFTDPRIRETVYEINCECAIDYSFNSELYNSVSSDVPSNEVQPLASYVSHTVPVTVNGGSTFDLDLVILADGDTLKEGQLSECISSATGISVVGDGYRAVWYTDAAMSKPLSFSEIRTVDDLLAIDQLYLSITAEQNNAVIISTGEFKSEVAKEYLTVLGAPSNSGHVQTTIEVCNITGSNNKKQILIDSDLANKATVCVNGSAVPESSYVNGGAQSYYDLSIQSGKIYHVHSVYTFTEESYSMLSLLFEL